MLVFLVLLVISIPGDRNELLARQVKVDAAQVAYELVFPAVGPIMESVIASIDNAEIDLSDNRLYTGLTGALTRFNRANTVEASQFQGVVTFSANVHSLLDGDDAVPELDTDEFRTLVADMDTTLSVAFLALMELNDARRTLLTEYIDQTGDVPGAQRIAGHANEATTLRYAQAASARELRRKAKLRYG